jgi:hypothetical protein
VKRFLQIAVVGLLSIASAFAQQTEVLDRLIAIVNNTPILQSDWEMALRCEALIAGRKPETLSAPEQRDVFNRLVDQELIREQMRGYSVTPVTDGDVDARIAQFREESHTKSDADWKALLDGGGVSEADVRAKVKSELEVLRFLDARMRPLVRVEFRSIRDYYRDHYVPELQKQGAQPAPLADVSDKIREIITQQRMDEQINAWLQTLRDGADIRFPKMSDDNQAAINESKP